MLTSIAASLINCLASAFQIAGTVITHLTSVSLRLLPCSFCKVVNTYVLRYLKASAKTCRIGRLSSLGLFDVGRMSDLENL